MVKSRGTFWKVVNNKVSDRMIDDSLCHMFTEHGKIRKRTQIFNRELRRFGRIYSYKKYVKIRTAVLRFISDDEDTEEEYFSNDDMYDIIKPEDLRYVYNNHDDCDIDFDYFDNMLCEKNCDKKILTQSSNIMIRSEFTSDTEDEELEEKDEEKKKLEVEVEVEVKVEKEEEEGEENFTVSNEPEIENSPTMDDIEQHVNKNLDKFVPNSYENDAMIFGDSGIDENSVDSLVDDANKLKKPREIIEKSKSEVLISPVVSKIKIVSTESVAFNYKKFTDSQYKQKNDNANENLLNNSFDEKTDEYLYDEVLTNSEKPQDTCKRKSISLAIPTEIDSLKCILSNLHVHNRYQNDFFIHDNKNEMMKENEFIDSQTNDIEFSRPMNLDDLMDIDDLIEMNAESTMTSDKITEDDEIFLMEIPKSIIDDGVLEGKSLQIKKHSVIFNGIEYESYRKQNDELCCILNKKGDNVNYEIGNIVPKESIVIRPKFPQYEMDKGEFTLEQEEQRNNYAPFPKKLKRRNPVAVDS